MCSVYSYYRELINNALITNHNIVIVTVSLKYELAPKEHYKDYDDGMAFDNSCMNTLRSMQLARRVTADQDIKQDIDFTLMIARKKSRNK